MADVSALLQREMARIQDHLERYLADGSDGHLFDTSHLGGRVDTTTLVLRVRGRSSGKIFFVPLIYAAVGNEYAIVASKGGSDEPPAWYLNLCKQDRVEIKIENECYSAIWRQLSGTEREKVWEIVSGHYPPYEDYKNKTRREIPVILLKTLNRIVDIR